MEDQTTRQSDGVANEENQTALADSGVQDLTEEIQRIEDIMGFGDFDVLSAFITAIFVWYCDYLRRRIENTDGSLMAAGSSNEGVTWP